jgi:hypothetical protein
MVDKCPFCKDYVALLGGKAVGSRLRLSRLRQGFLILGALWGMMAASREYLPATSVTGNPAQAY